MTSKSRSGNMEYNLVLWGSLSLNRYGSACDRNTTVD